MAKKLYTVEHAVLAYFWAEEGEEQEAAESAFRDECSNIWLDQPNYLGLASPILDANWIGSIPWGEAPDGWEDLTLGEIRDKYRKAVGR